MHEVCPFAFWYVPIGQSFKVPSPLAYVPSSQGLQSSADPRPSCVDDLPAGHLLHLLTESNPVADEYVFAEQFLHALIDVAFVVSPYLPMGQLLQDVWPVSF